MIQVGLTQCAHIVRHYRLFRGLFNYHRIIPVLVVLLILETIKRFVETEFFMSQ